MERPLVVAIVEDIFFSAKIEAAARSSGVELKIIHDAAQLDAQREAPAPALIILDLNCRALAPLPTIRRIKSDPRLAVVRMVGFLSHIQVDRAQAAREAGCDEVMARSAFSARLPTLLAPAGLADSR